MKGLTLRPILFYSIVCFSGFITPSLSYGDTLVAGSQRSPLNRFKATEQSLSEAKKKFYEPQPLVAFTGIIPKALTMKQPWQLINPLAPKSLGYGKGMTSWNKVAGKPKGFIFFGISF